MATEKLKPTTTSDDFTLSPITSGDFLSEYSRKPGLEVANEEQQTKSGSFRTYPKFDGSKFENPWTTWERPRFHRTVRFLCSRAGRSMRRPLPAKEVLESKLPLQRPKFLTAANSNSNDTATKTLSSSGSSIPTPLEITWIGHASTVVTIDGITILTDPIFSDYCSPVPIGSLRRFRETPCKIDDLPDSVKIVVISHNHYDHLDHQSVVELHRRYGDKLTFCVPKGLAEWFRDNISGLRPSAVVEMNWWQSAKFELRRDGISSDDAGKAFQVVCTPTQHWSMRHPFNRNKSLWCSWVVIGPSGRRFFFGGDTGYCTVFKEIGAELGPFDLAAIPIGAYEPREFLRPQHVNPTESVEIHVDIGCKKSVGIHWGTFRLGGEDTLAPPVDLAAAVAARGLPSDAFVTIAHGETLTVPATTSS